MARSLRFRVIILQICPIFRSQTPVSPIFPSYSMSNRTCERIINCFTLLKIPDNTVKERRLIIIGKKYLTDKIICLQWIKYFPSTAGVAKDRHDHWYNLLIRWICCFILWTQSAVSGPFQCLYHGYCMHQNIETVSTYMWMLLNTIVDIIKWMIYGNGNLVDRTDGGVRNIDMYGSYSYHEKCVGYCMVYSVQREQKTKSRGLNGLKLEVWPGGQRYLFLSNLLHFLLNQFFLVILVNLVNLEIPGEYWDSGKSGYILWSWWIWWLWWLCLTWCFLWSWLMVNLGKHHLTEKR